MFSKVYQMTQSSSLPNTRKLQDYLYSRQEEMIALLAQLVTAESPSLIPTAQKPVLTILQQELRQRGYVTYQDSKREDIYWAYLAIAVLNSSINSYWDIAIRFGPWVL